MKKKNFLIFSGLLIVVIVVGLVILIKRNDEVAYVYDASISGNNYDLVIENGKALSGDLYSYDGEWLAELKDGKAIVNEGDISQFPKFKIKVNDKIYVITKK